MQSYEVISGPLADAAVWRGALIWAVALYVPLSAPLNGWKRVLKPAPFQRIGGRDPDPQQPSAGVGHGTDNPAGMQLGLGPGWASSLGVVVLGWSLLLTLTNRDSN